MHPPHSTPPPPKKKNKIKKIGEYYWKPRYDGDWKATIIQACACPHD